MEPAGINAQLHAIAASDDAVDVLVHEHFSAYFLADASPLWNRFVSD